MPFMLINSFIQIVSTRLGYSILYLVKDMKAVYTRAGGSDPTTSTLVRPKILPFMVKIIYFQNFGQINNCTI